MAISFEKAVKLLEERKITSYSVKKTGAISQGTLTKLKRNKCVTTDTINTLCNLLQCQPGDLMEWKADE